MHANRSYQEIKICRTNIPRNFLMTLLIISGLISKSCSQSKSPPRDIFVGSTPCDSLIKSMTGIPTGKFAEFLKWELHISKVNRDTGSYQITVFYGESQPNTNGFKGGGEKLSWDGKYVTLHSSGNPNKMLYRLTDSSKEPLFYLIEMDSNIFHFADRDGKLLVGNGGWGYVLNKIQ